MAITYEDTANNEAVVMEKPRKPLHTRIVSIGAFILISMTLFILMDLFAIVLAAQVSVAILSEVQTANFIMIVRLVGILSLIISAFFAAFGAKVFTHRAGRYLQRVLVAFFCFIMFMLGSIGFAILITFTAFFFTPKIVARYQERALVVYRYHVIGFILAATFAPVLISSLKSLWIGVLLAPAAPFLILTGVSWIVLLPAFIVIPIFLYFPRIIQGVWNLRPNIESFWNEFLHHKMGMVGLIIISSIVLVALFAPLIAPYHWGDGSLALEDLLQYPSPEHILGTNMRGEDIFSRLIYGSQISLLVGFTASVVAVFLGTIVGLVSGYFGGIIDSILMRITDVFLCLPTLPLMLIFLVIFGQGLQNVIVVIAMLSWTGTARMVRSEALSLRERPLTEAAHALGGSDTYILFRHIMPNTFPLILANMILGVVNAILSEAGIAFLGFVDIHGQPSWGILLHWAWKNAALLSNKWWWFIPPGILIMLTTLGFVFISHTADKVVNPRLRGRRG